MGSFGILKNCAESVSYTHLYVYKRQEDEDVQYYDGGSGRDGDDEENLNYDDERIDEKEDENEIGEVGEEVCEGAGDEGGEEIGEELGEDAVKMDQMSNWKVVRLSLIHI